MIYPCFIILLWFGVAEGTGVHCYTGQRMGIFIYSGVFQWRVAGWLALGGRKGGIKMKNWELRKRRCFCAYSVIFFTDDVSKAQRLGMPYIYML